MSFPVTQSFHHEMSYSNTSILIMKLLIEDEIIYNNNLISILDSVPLITNSFSRHANERVKSSKKIHVTLLILSPTRET